MATLPCLVWEEVQDCWLTNDDNCDDRDHCDTGNGYPGNVGPTNPVCPLDNFFSRCLSWRYPLRTMRLLEDELTVVARRRCCRTGLPTATNLTVEHICQHQDMLYQPASLTPHQRCSSDRFRSAKFWYTRVAHWVQWSRRAVAPQNFDLAPPV